MFNWDIKPLSSYNPFLVNAASIHEPITSLREKVSWENIFYLRIQNLLSFRDL